MKKHKFGFTLSELLIAIAVLGVLGAVLTPVLTKLMPSQNKVMIKRTYYMITNTVQKMIDDDTIYSPYGTGTLATKIVYKGFDNLDEVNFEGNTYSGETKFANIFSDIIGAKKLERETTKLGLTSPYLDSYDNVLVSETKDGVIWRFYKSNGYFINHFQELEYLAAIILVDVNGNKGPNTHQNPFINDVKSNFDQYVVFVYQDGKVGLCPDDVWVRSIINASSSVGID